LGSHETGLAAEDAVSRLIEGRGWRLLERRWRGRRGEVDLIAQDGSTLVFIEVKARGEGAWSSAASAVDPRKQRRLCRAAEEYSARSGRDEQIRFDVAAVSGERIDLIEDAFRPEPTR